MTFLKQIAMAQYCIAILQMMKKYNLPRYARPILDIPEVNPRMLEPLEVAEFGFSEN